MKCPFDPSHIMPYDRFLNHLDKCKFADKKSYTKCKYNSYHIIHKERVENHEKSKRSLIQIAKTDTSMQSLMTIAGELTISLSNMKSLRSQLSQPPWPLPLQIALPTRWPPLSPKWLLRWNLTLSRSMTLTIMISQASRKPDDEIE